MVLSSGRGDSLDARFANPEEPHTSFFSCLITNPLLSFSCMESGCMHRAIFLSGKTLLG
jgi:hypothetical protein